MIERNLFFMGNWNFLLSQFFQERERGNWKSVESILKGGEISEPHRVILESFMHMDREEFEKAEEKLLDLLTNEDLLNRFLVYVTLMNLYWNWMKIEKILPLEKEATKIFNQLNNSQLEDFRYWEAIFYNIQSKLESGIGNLGKAEELLLKSKKLFEYLGDGYAVVRSLIGLANIQKDKGDYLTMIEILNGAERMLDDMDITDFLNKKLRYMIKGNIASSLLKLKRYEDALKNYEQNEMLVAEVGTKTDYCILLINKGAAANALERYDEGVQYLLRAIEIAEQEKNRFILAYAYRNLADVEFSRKRLNDASKYLSTSNEIAQEQKIHILMASNYSVLAQIRAYQGELNEALEYIEKVNTLIDENKGIYDPDFLIATYYSMAKIMAFQGDLDKSLIYLQKRLAICEKVGDTRDISHTLFAIFLLAHDLEEITLEQETIENIRKLDLSHQGVRNLADLASAIQIKDQNPEASYRILNRLVNENLTHRNYDIEHNVLVLYNLCEVDILQYRHTKAVKFLEDAEKVIGTLKRLAKEESLINLRFETAILEAKLFMLQLKMDEARMSLIMALEGAKEHSFHSIEKEITTEIERISTGKGFFEDIDEMIEQTQILLFLRSKGGSRGSLPTF